MRSFEQLQLLAELSNRLIALSRFLIETLRYNVLELCRYGVQPSTREGRAADQAVIDHCAKGVHICARADPVTVVELLGCHVRDRPDAGIYLSNRSAV